MKTVIIRKKQYQLGQIWSSFVGPFIEKDYSTKDELVQEFGWKKLMSSLYQEEIESDDICSTSLYKSYKALLNSNDKDNADFIKAYLINEEFAVYVDANIYLIHLMKKGDLSTDLVSWYCSDGQVYIGDPWWETDEEILHNVESLSVVDFLCQYKGWCWPEKKLF